MRKLLLLSTGSWELSHPIRHYQRGKRQRRRLSRAQEITLNDVKLTARDDLECIQLSKTEVRGLSDRRMSAKLSANFCG
jgi:hypothetical protein